MLIDWLSLMLSYEHLEPGRFEQLRNMGDRIMRFSMLDGSVQWETAAWDSIRSDSHALSFRAGGDGLYLQGSPARVIGDGCSVFGSGAASALDIQGCALAMIAHLEHVIGFHLPIDVSLWKCTRIDVTGNLLLEDLASVRVALRLLRDCEGGRYRVSQNAGDTVYWSHKSHLRSGKAYAKGPHLRYMLKNDKLPGITYFESQLQLAERLLRLELKLGSQLLRERLAKPWFELTSDDLITHWQEYFYRMIGEAEMTNDETLQQKLLTVCEKSAQAKSTFGCYLLIKHVGWERAKNSFAKRTWYRHMKYLRLAGLGDADISAGNVVQLRRKIIECQLVNSWEELYQSAKAA